MPRKPVKSPERPPGRFGLVSALGGDEAIVSSSGPVDEWADGLQSWSDPCGTSTEVFGPCDITTLDIDDMPCGVDFSPFVVSEGIAINSAARNLSEDEIKKLAGDRLIQWTSYKVEQEIWEGAWAIAEGNGNRYFAQPPAEEPLNKVLTGVLSPIDALGWLQQSLAESRNAAGMIHTSLVVATWWKSLGGICVEDDKLVDIYGNIIVAGAGYPPPDAGGIGSAVATGMIDLYLSPVEVSTPAMNYTINKWAASADRFAAAVWDCESFITTSIDAASLCGGPAPTIS